MITTKKKANMNVAGFEEIGNLSPEINENRQQIIAVIVDNLYLCVGKKKAITSIKLRTKIKSVLGIIVTSPQLRILIRHIRMSGILKLVLAGGKGYWRAKTEDEIRKYLESLKERETQIRDLRNAIKNQLIERKKEKKNEQTRY